MSVVHSNEMRCVLFTNDKPLDLFCFSRKKRYLNHENQFDIKKINENVLATLNIEWSIEFLHIHFGTFFQAQIRSLR